MKIENQRTLLQGFPDLVKNLNWDPKKGFPAITCSDGWGLLIIQLCFAIQDELNKIKMDDPQIAEGIYIVGVHEKSGKMRFDISYGTKKIYSLIDKFEKNSLKICELCGMGAVPDPFWDLTLCGDCSKKISL